MARAALRWQVTELAKRAQLGPATVTRFEANGTDARSSTMKKLKFVLEAAGVTFLDDDGFGVGVRFKT